MKKVLKFVKGKKSSNNIHNSTSSEVINSDKSVDEIDNDKLSAKPTCSQSSLSDQSSTNDNTKANICFNNEQIVEQLNNLSEHIEKSLQEDDDVSVLSVDKQDSSLTSTSPQSGVIPPPCKPLRSLEYLHTTENSTQKDFQDVKSNLVVLGTVRTRHISFTETPGATTALSNNRLSYHNDTEIGKDDDKTSINNWSSEKNLPISLSRTAYHVKASPLKNPNQHFKRYSLDYNFKTKFPLSKPDALPITEDCLQTEFEQLESYDDALKHLEKCDLEQIHHKSRSLPRTIDTTNFDAEFKSNSMSLPRSLTMNDESFASICDCPLSKSFCDHDHFGILFIKKPLFKHFKNLFDYKKNLKRGKKLVKSFSFSKSEDSGSSERNNRFQSDDVKKDPEFMKTTKDFKMSPDTQNIGLSKVHDYMSANIHKTSAKFCCATRMKEQELEKEVIRWKKQYNDVLKKIESIDADAKAMENILHSNSSHSSKTINDNNSMDELSQSPNNVDVSEVVNILQNQYDKVENVLLKQNEKLETIVHKLNAELETTKQKEFELERQLQTKQKSTSMVEITISGTDSNKASVTLLAEENEEIQEALKVLKQHLETHDTKLDVFSIQIGSGQSIYERLANLEKENKALKLENVTKDVKINSTQTDPLPDDTRELINVLNILEKQIETYEKTIKSQQNEIFTQKTIVQNLTDSLKSVTDDKASLTDYVTELKTDLESLKKLVNDQRVVINNYSKEIDRLKDSLQNLETNTTSNDVTKELQIKSEQIKKLQNQIDQQKEFYLTELKTIKELNKELEIQMIDLLFNRNTLETELNSLKHKYQCLEDERNEEQGIFEMSNILRKMQSKNNDLKMAIFKMKSSFDYDQNPSSDIVLKSKKTSQSLPNILKELPNTNYKSILSIKNHATDERKSCKSRSNSMPNVIYQTNDKAALSLPPVDDNKVNVITKRSKSDLILYDNNLFARNLVGYVYRNIMDPFNKCYCFNNTKRLSKSIDFIDDGIQKYSNDWNYNIKVIEKLCTEVSDIKEEITKTNQSIDLLRDVNQFQEMLYNFQKKLQQLQDHINYENKRHFSVEWQLKVLEKNIAIGQQRTTKSIEQLSNYTNDAEVKANENKLRLQFEETRQKLETELKNVQTKLNETYKCRNNSLLIKCRELITHKSNPSRHRPISQEQFQFCSHCTGIIFKNKDQHTKFSHREKKLCTCGEETKSSSIALHYRLQLNSTIEKNRTTSDTMYLIYRNTSTSSNKTTQSQY